MYCKKCNTLVENEDLICPYCKFDNHEDFNETTEIYLDRISQRVNKVEEKKRNYKTVIILLIFIISGVIIFYLVKDGKTLANNEEIVTTTQKIVILNTKFNYKNIVLSYSNENFGASTNTIFYKNNNNYNITTSIVDENNYNDIINSNELLDSKLGDVDVKTYANEESFSYLLTHKDENYLISVVYDNTDTDKEAIQLEISKILNSIELK